MSGNRALYQPGAQATGFPAQPGDPSLALGAGSESPGPASYPGVAEQPAPGGRAPFLRALGVAVVRQFTLPLRPRKTIRDSADLPLPAVYLAHLVTVPLGLLLLVLVAVGLEHGDSVRQVKQMLRMLAHEARYPKLWLVLGFITLFIELGFLGLACSGLAWSARAEPVRQSCRRAFRTAWLSNGLVLACALAMVLWVDWTSSLRIAAYRGLSATQMRLGYAEMPWIIRNDDTLNALFCIGLGTAGFLIAMRAMSPRGASADPSGDPICESCGYNLSHTPIDSRCPECGEPAANSLNGGLRRPLDWELRPRAGAYLRTLCRALVGPTAFFRGMQTQSGHPAAHRFVIITLGLAAALTVLATIPAANAAHTRLNADDLLAISAGMLCGAGSLLVLVLVAASLMGLIESRRQGRNLLPGFAKVFLYGSSAYLFWAPGAVLLLAVLIHVSESMPRGVLPLLRPYGWGRADQVLLLTFLLNALPAVFTAFVHRRGLRQVTYANT